MQTSTSMCDPFSSLHSCSGRSHAMLPAHNSGGIAWLSPERLQSRLPYSYRQPPTQVNHRNCADAQYQHDSTKVAILDLDWKFTVQNSSLEARLFKREWFTVLFKKMSLQINSSFPTKSENQLTLCSTRCVPGFLVWLNVRSGTSAGNAEKRELTMA